MSSVMRTWKDETTNVWQSRRQQAPGTTIDAALRALYERVELSLSSGFASAQRALIDMQLQIQIKLRQLREQQEFILQIQRPSLDAVQEFEDNVRKIDRSLESFTAHAADLSHIKCTLNRAAFFASPEGNLAQLVIKAPQPREDLWQPDSLRTPLSMINSSETQSKQPSCTGSSTVLTASAPPYQPRQFCGSLSDSCFLQGMSSDLCSLDGSDLALGSSLNSQSKAFHPEQSLESNFEHIQDGKESNLERKFGPDGSLGFDRLKLNMSSNRNSDSSCFVFYLPQSFTNEHLGQLFSRYGTVLNAYIAVDKVTNRPRGFGFVDFSTPSEAQAAVAGLDKYVLEGKFLNVSIKI